MQLILMVFTWDDESGQGEVLDYVRCPGDVNGLNVDSYIQRLYGDPIDRSVTSTPTLERLEVGWVFPPESEGGADRHVVPMVRDEEGELVPMLVQHEEQRALFKRMEEQGTPVAWVRVEPEEY